MFRFFYLLRPRALFVAVESLFRNKSSHRIEEASDADIGHDDIGVERRVEDDKGFCNSRDSGEYVEGDKPSDNAKEHADWADRYIVDFVFKPTSC